MIDGGDVFDYQLNISSSLAQYNEGYCCIGGGVVCNITLERHIKLVNADKMSLKWRLGSLYVLDGECESLSLPPSFPPSLPLLIAISDMSPVSFLLFFYSLSLSFRIIWC